MEEFYTKNEAIGNISKIIDALEQSQEIMKTLNQQTQDLAEEIFRIGAKVKVMSKQIDSLMGEEIHDSH
tara:strand:+ start:1975 stop:2181 length:207 start_codon:yes stop_codon:yes gene_type:complete